jgi:YrbI family 3-deoxy-D-manno-octulosonate 8-phosphate phosphatase
MKKLNEARDKIANCLLIVFDFDGVMTDNKVYVSQTGEEMVRCDRSDGLGIDMLRQTKRIELLILSKEKNEAVQARATKLQVSIIQGAEDKFAILKNLLDQRNIEPDRVCYVGNDINDLECLQYVGLPIIVADAHPEIKKNIDFYITTQNGGNGAVREICDLFLHIIS